MPQRTYRYHQEYAPHGRVFDLEKVSDQSLVDQGWVDNPAKFGLNVWGGPNEAMAEVKQQFEEGKVPAIGTPNITPRAEEMSALEREKDRAYDELRLREDENEALRRQLRESKEKLADHRSDAAKIEEQKAESQTQVPKGAPAEKPKPAAKAKPKTEEKPAGGSDTDL